MIKQITSIALIMYLGLSCSYSSSQQDSTNKVLTIEDDKDKYKGPFDEQLFKDEQLEKLPNLDARI